MWRYSLKQKSTVCMSQSKYLVCIKLKMLILFLHPALLSGWAGQRSAAGNICICTMWISPAAGFWHTIAAPGSQSSQFLALRCRDPQGYSLSPAASTDPLTRTCTDTHTHTLTVHQCCNLAWSNSPFSSWSGSSLSSPSHFTRRDTHTYAHTYTHKCTQSIPHSGKGLERRLVRRQDRLHWLGTGYSRRSVLTTPVHTWLMSFIPLFLCLPMHVPPCKTFTHPIPHLWFPP